MAASLTEPGIRAYATGIVLGLVLSFAQAPLPEGFTKDALSWLPWIVYAQASALWALSLFVSRYARAWLLLLAALPFLPLNVAYVLLLYPVHLIPLAFLAVGAGRSLTSVAAREGGTPAPSLRAD